MLAALQSMYVFGTFVHMCIFKGRLATSYHLILGLGKRAPVRGEISALHCSTNFKVGLFVDGLHRFLFAI